MTTRDERAEHEKAEAEAERQQQEQEEAVVDARVMGARRRWRY